MDLSDDELMKQTALGDKMSFEKLFLRHSGHLLGYAQSYLGKREAGEEVTQEVWMKVIRVSPSYKGQGQFVAWLYTLTRHQCLNVLRSQKRLVYFDSDEAVEKIPSKQELESELLEQTELLKVQEAIQKLPDLQRVSLLLHVVEGLSYEDIATEIETSIAAVKSLIYRARTALILNFERPSK